MSLPATFLFRQSAFRIPLGTGRFHLGLIFKHALAAFHVEIGDMSVSLPHFLFRQHLSPAAATLWAGGFNRISFFCHSKPPISDLIA